MTTPTSRRAALIVLALLTAACAGEPELTVAEGNRPAAATTTVDPATSVDTSASASLTATTNVTTNEKATATVTTDAAEPAAPPFPAAALPIRQRFVFDAPVGNPYGFDDELLVWHGTSEVARLDLGTGEISTASLVADDQLRAEAFYAMSTGDEYVVVVDTAGQGSVDAMITVDPQTLAIIGRSPSTQRATVNFASGPPPRSITASRGSDLTRFDAASASTGALIEADFPGRVHWNRGEFWTWTAAGEVTVRDPEFESVASIDLGMQLDVFLSSPTLVTDQSFWFADEQRGVLVGIDRESYTIVHRIDLREHFGWADAIRMRPSDPDTGFVLVNAVVGDEGWWMLVGIDAATGLVTSEHVIASDSFEQGWNAFEGPAVASIGDRVFVRDHLRSIVEVDTSALGDALDMTWPDPGLTLAPSLDPDEQEVADATLDFLARPDGTSTPIDDKAAAAPAREALAAFAVDLDDWQIYSAQVVGDRAWSRAGPVSESIGAFFVLHRIDGVWHIAADGLCALAFSAPCADL